MFKLQPKASREHDPNWVRVPQIPVTINLPQPQFNRLKLAGRDLDLSMRQIVTQMITYAEESMTKK